MPTSEKLDFQLVTGSPTKVWDIYAFACFSILHFCVSHRPQYHLYGKYWINFLLCTSESEGGHSINSVYWHKAWHQSCKCCCEFYPSKLHPSWLPLQSQPLISFCSLPAEPSFLTFQRGPYLFFRIICKRCCLLLKHTGYVWLNIFTPWFVT